ncbi:Precursor of CEP4, partial [Cucurbita argyrosperma subsp. sororia]
MPLRSFHLLALVVFLLYFLSVTSRPRHDIYSPAIVVGFGNRHAITPPASMSTFSINRYKYVEMDAFRPTSPGHSPGVGHKDPPGAS